MGAMRRLQIMALAAALCGGCAGQAPPEHDPNEVAILYQRGNSHSELRDHTRAIADFDQAAMLDPQNGLYQLGRCTGRFMANRELEVARAACDHAIALATDADEHVSALHGRGLVGLRQERWQDAWNDFDAAMRATPDMHAHYVYGRGVAALRLGRASDAQSDIAGALSLDPSIAETFAGYGITP
jgi:tetratricopeptide (TPR) repeat protein